MEQMRGRVVRGWTGEIVTLARFVQPQWSSMPSWTSMRTARRVTKRQVEARNVEAAKLVDSCVFINAFKVDSEFRDASLQFLSELARRKTLIAMPAHGWFEVWCSLRRIERNDNAFAGPVIDGLQQYPLELIHIDSQFILKYGNVDIPYIKAGDHIYLVVAHVEGYRLVTGDKGMTRVARELNVDVCTPSELPHAGRVLGVEMPLRQTLPHQRGKLATKSIYDIPLCYQRLSPARDDESSEASGTTSRNARSASHQSR